MSCIFHTQPLRAEHTEAASGGPCLHPRPDKKPGPNYRVCSLDCQPTVLTEGPLCLFGTLRHPCSINQQNVCKKIPVFDREVSWPHIRQKSFGVLFSRGILLEEGNFTRLSYLGWENNYPEAKMIKETCLYSLCNNFSNHFRLVSNVLVNKAKRKSKVEILHQEMK